jgi:regulator of replication initiation timing
VSPSSSNDVIIPPLKCASEIVASVESWQKTKVELVVENEQLRKQVQHLRKVLDEKETVCQSAGKTRELCLDEEANNNFGLKTHVSRDDDDEVHICSLKRDFTKDLRTQQQEVFSGREHLKPSSASSKQGEQHGNNNSYEDVKLVLERMSGIESLLSMISNDVPIIIISHCDANLRYTYIKYKFCTQTLCIVSLLCLSSARKMYAFFCCHFCFLVYGGDMLWASSGWWLVGVYPRSFIHLLVLTCTLGLRSQCLYLTGLCTSLWSVFVLRYACSSD